MTQPPAKKWRSILPWFIGIVALVGVGLSVITILHKPAQQTGEESATPPLIPVRVAKTELRTLTPTIEVIGVVQPDPRRYSIVSAATTGLVEKVLVREGERVAQNEPVVQLDERPAQSALDRAEAAYARLIAKPRPEELQEAQLLVDKARSANAAAEARLKKAQELRTHNPELVPEVDLLDEQRNAEAAKADWETAQAQLELLKQGARAEVRRESQVEVEAAKLQLAYCTVRAPLAGDVVELKAVVGQRADVGTPLVTILDSSEVLVQSRVPSDRLAGVLAVMQDADHQKLATIRCLSFPNETFTAHAGWLGDQTEAQTSDVPIKLRVPNPKGLLRVGMTVQVKLYEQPVEGVAIPNVAVTVNEEGRHVVTVIRDGKAVPTEITIASENEPEVRAQGWIRVLSGLKPGDEVAVENGYALPQDTPVKILPPVTPEIAAGLPAVAPNRDEQP